MKCPRFRFLVLLLFFMLRASLHAQDLDLEYAPLFKTKTRADNRPVVAIDEAHNNMHTAHSGYLPFASLLSRDGYSLRSISTPLTKELLDSIDVLVIANAIGEPSAFKQQEIKDIHRWVKEDGGALFLIADHMPFAGMAASLAEGFDVTFYNAFAFDSTGALDYDLFTRATGLLTQNELTNSARFNVDTVASYLGQAFRIPADFKCVLRMNDNFKLYFPEIPWQFTKDQKVLPAGGLCQGAFGRIGKGKIVVWGEAAMFTARKVGATKVGMNTSQGKNNYKLLLNIIDWLTE